jgi:hypothetical protein
MTNIDDLNKSITEMPDEELYELLGSIRSNRRKQPEKTAKPKKKNGSKKNSVTKMVENMTAEERQKLIEELSK